MNSYWIDIQIGEDNKYIKTRGDLSASIKKQLYGEDTKKKNIDKQYKSQKKQYKVRIWWSSKDIVKIFSSKCIISEPLKQSLMIIPGIINISICDPCQSSINLVWVESETTTMK